MHLQPITRAMTVYRRVGNYFDITNDTEPNDIQIEYEISRHVMKTSRGLSFRKTSTPSTPVHLKNISALAPTKHPHGPRPPSVAREGSYSGPGPTSGLQG